MGWLSFPLFCMHDLSYCIESANPISEKRVVDCIGGLHLTSDWPDQETKFLDIWMISGFMSDFV